MRTIRYFFNVAEAQLAQSVLKTAGIESVILDERMYTTGPQNAPVGIRMQVHEKDAEHALKVLDGKKIFSRLPGNIASRSVPKPVLKAKPVSSCGCAFVKGGLWALALFIGLAFVAMIFGGTAHADLGGLVLLFILGGIVGLIVRAIYKSGFDNGAMPH